MPLIIFARALVRSFWFGLVASLALRTHRLVCKQASRRGLEAYLDEAGRGQAALPRLRQPVGACMPTINT